MKRLMLSLFLSLILALSCLSTCFAANVEADPEQSTDAVDSSTTLPDGAYTPNSFSFSGGTGKVQITCPEIRIKDGKATAVIVFSSSSYSYVKASGIICYADIVGKTSIFTIPIALNQNNRILALTTKMSSPHEVEYQIFPALKADSSSEADAIADIPGLSFLEQINTEHSSLLKLYRFNNDIILAEIDTLTEGNDDSESLYTNRFLRYLIIPEGAEVPAGMEKEYIIIQKPITSVYAAGIHTEDCMQGHEALITAVADESSAANGRSYAGSIETPNYKVLILNKVNLILADDMALSSLADGVGDRITTLGIPLIPDCSGIDSAEAESDWMMLYDLLFR